MRNYELTLLLKADLTDVELQGLLGEVSSILQDQGALVISQDTKGKRHLISGIKKQYEAKLAVIKFTLDPQSLIIVEKELKTKDAILRFAILLYIPKKAQERILAKASVISVAKEATEEEKVEIEDIDKKLEEIFREDNL